MHERLGSGSSATCWSRSLRRGVRGWCLEESLRATRWGERRRDDRHAGRASRSARCARDLPGAVVLCTAFVLSAGLRGLGGRSSKLRQRRTHAARNSSAVGATMSRGPVRCDCGWHLGPDHLERVALLLFACRQRSTSRRRSGPQLPARPSHLDQGHPERPAEAELAHFGGVVSARWSDGRWLRTPISTGAIDAGDLPGPPSRCRARYAAAALFDVVRVTSFIRCLDAPVVRGADERSPRGDRHSLACRPSS